MDGIAYCISFLLTFYIAWCYARDEVKVKRKPRKPLLPPHERDKHERLNSERTYSSALDGRSHMM